MTRTTVAPLLAIAAFAFCAACGSAAEAPTKWIVERSVDDFDGTSWVIAKSPTTFGSPYTESSINVRCQDGKRLEAFFSYESLRGLGGYSRWGGTLAKYKRGVMFKFDDQTPTEHTLRTPNDGKGFIDTSSWAEINAMEIVDGWMQQDSPRGSATRTTTGRPSPSGTT